MAPQHAVLTCHARGRLPTTSQNRCCSCCCHLLLPLFRCMDGTGQASGALQPVSRLIMLRSFGVPTPALPFYLSLPPDAPERPGGQREGRLPEEVLWRGVPRGHRAAGQEPPPRGALGGQRRDSARDAHRPEAHDHARRRLQGRLQHRLLGGSLGMGWEIMLCAMLKSALLTAASGWAESGVGLTNALVWPCKERVSRPSLFSSFHPCCSCAHVFSHPAPLLACRCGRAGWATAPTWRPTRRWRCVRPPRKLLLVVCSCCSCAWDGLRWVELIQHCSCQRKCAISTPVSPTSHACLASPLPTSSHRRAPSR